MEIAANPEVEPYWHLVDKQKSNLARGMLWTRWQWGTKPTVNKETGQRPANYWPRAATVEMRGSEAFWRWINLAHLVCVISIRVQFSKVPPIDSTVGTYFKYPNKYLSDALGSMSFSLTLLSFPILCNYLNQPPLAKYWWTCIWGLGC